MSGLACGERATWCLLPPLAAPATRHAPEHRQRLRFTSMKTNCSQLATRTCAGSCGRMSGIVRSHTTRTFAVTRIFTLDWSAERIHAHSSQSRSFSSAI